MKALIELDGTYIRFTPDLGRPSFELVHPDIPEPFTIGFENENLQTKVMKLIQESIDLLEKRTYY